MTIRELAMSWRAHECALGILLVSACGARDEGRSPTATVRAFLTAVDHAAASSRETAYDVGGAGFVLPAEREAAEAMFRLLDAESRALLQSRADLTRSMAGGRAFEPWEMIAPGTLRIRFTPVDFDETISGDTARVIAKGRAPADRAQIDLVRESGTWRIRLGLRSAASP